MNKKSLKLIIILIAATTTAAISSCSQSADIGDLTVVNGKWNRSEDNISLFKIVDGRLEEVANTKVSADSTFGMAIPVKKEGFYTIGTHRAQMEITRYTFYFTPGCILNIEFNDTTYSLTGSNTQENKAMERWHNFILPLETNFFRTNGGKGSSTYANYFPLLEEKLKDLETKDFGSTDNPTFNSAFNNFRKYDLMFLAVAFNYLPRTAHPSQNDFIQYYKDLDLSNITSNAGILKHPFGARLLTNLIYISKQMQLVDNDADFHSLLKNDTLIGEMAAQSTSRIDSYQTFLEFEEYEGKYILTDDQKARVKAAKNKLAKNNKEGQPAVDFKYSDINGKQVALSDLKGKVVLIDVWATWCGPCKAQIPHLKKMEKDYHGKDIVFLSVSVDEKKNEQKWKDFVKKEELGGIQLFAGGFKSDIAQSYNIQSIPRFILIDKEGKMVSASSPRPSDPKLRVMVDKLLK
ncbi:MAG: TlpA family protein disulfide reductase [Bacteroidales bacterium]